MPVKDAVLKALEQKPGSYWKRFRACESSGRKLHIEFARNLSINFNRWCSSLEKKTFKSVWPDCFGADCSLRNRSYGKDSCYVCCFVFVSVHAFDLLDNVKMVLVSDAMICQLFAVCKDAGVYPPDDCLLWTS